MKTFLLSAGELESGVIRIDDGMLEQCALEYEKIKEKRPLYGLFTPFESFCRQKAALIWTGKKWFE
jgi:hypothetical protein